MAPTESVPAFEARLALYRLDDRARAILTKTWPVIAPYLESAIDEMLGAVTKLPNIGQVLTQNKDLIKKLEVAHFQALLGGNIDQHYADLCRQTVRQEAAIGLDARVRSTSGSSCSRWCSTRWRASIVFLRRN